MPTFLAKEAWQFPMMINLEDSIIRCKKKSSKLDIISLAYAYLCIG